MRKKEGSECETKTVTKTNEKQVYYIHVVILPISEGRNKYRIEFVS